MATSSSEGGSDMSGAMQVRKIEPQPEYFVDGSNDGWWLYKEKIHTGVNMTDVLMDEYADDPEYEGLKPVLVDDIWYWQSSIDCSQCHEASPGGLFYISDAQLCGKCAHSFA